ncbi:uncharacterized protein SPSK_01292 [Sporothrix schenckii 1099-18]|uniref:Uncharacterized protein n=1 Tax=Sporothrix schenckii 1099-18 TaxID=1397361 RepID=A0A0F2LZN7_SPOSC|nr:uncharacterized protein SPSK_01292 [Sporothrix schenckii 1099-18]KJR81371.1 hypothetical protein SPSK_01292 [Sporothrix schenckii 1099-18]
MRLHTPAFDSQVGPRDAATHRDAISLSLVQETKTTTTNVAAAPSKSPMHASGRWALALGRSWRVTARKGQAQRAECPGARREGAGGVQGMTVGELGLAIGVLCWANHTQTHNFTTYYCACLAITSHNPRRQAVV